MPRNLFFFLVFLIALTSQNIGISKARAEEEKTVPIATESILDDPDYDPHHPYYQSAHPTWALGLRAGIHGVPFSGAIGDTYQIYGEYFLPFHHIGAFSVGPFFGLLPLYAPNTSLPYPDYSNFSLGAAFRYQLKFVTDQLIVPTAAIGWEYYRLLQEAGQSEVLTGGFFSLSAGLMLNLGSIDRVTEREGYQSLGLVRSYLTIEVKAVNINSAPLSVSGSSWLFGLRLEFE